MTVLEFGRPTGAALLFGEDEDAALTAAVRRDARGAGCTDEHVRAHAAALLELAGRASLGDESFYTLLRALSSVFPQISSSASSETLLCVRGALEALHRSSVVWRLAAAETARADRGLSSRLLQLYFSIPDRIVAVFEPSRSDPLSHRSFLATLARGLHGGVPAAWTADVVAKSHAIGGFPVLVERMLAEQLHPAVHACLERLPSVHLEPFVRDLLHHTHLAHLGRAFLDVGCVVALAQDLRAAFAEHLCRDSHVHRILCTAIPELTIELFAGIVCEMQDQRAHAVFEGVLRLLAGRWSLRSGRVSFSLPADEDLTSKLLVVLGYASHEMLRRLGLEAVLFEGIQGRLDSADGSVSLLGKVVAECYALISGAETRLLFEVAGEVVERCRACFLFGERVERAISAKEGRAYVAPGTGAFEQAAAAAAPTTEDFALTEPTIPSSTPPLGAAECATRPIMQITEVDEEPRNAKIRRPRFLRDCLAYLKCSDDPVKVELGLQAVVPLLSCASRLLVQEIGVEVYRAVLFLGEDFEIADFDAGRRAALSLLTLILPSTIGRFVVGEVVGRNANTRQKLEILCAAMVALQSDREPRREDRTARPAMTVLERQLMPELSVSATAPPGAGGMASVVQGVVLPLVAGVGDAHSQVFQHSRGLLLEKFLLLLGVCLYYGGNLADFRRLMRSFMHFTRCLLGGPSAEQHQQQQSRPIVRAHLLGIQAMLSAWPDHIPTIEHLDYVASASRYLEAIVEMEACDEECRVSAATSLIMLQERADPATLLREATASMALEIEQVGLPTSRPPAVSIPRMVASPMNLG